MEMGTLPVGACAGRDLAHKAVLAANHLSHAKVENLEVL